MNPFPYSVPKKNKSPYKIERLINTTKLTEPYRQFLFHDNDISNDWRKLDISLYKFMSPGTRKSWVDIRNNGVSIHVGRLIDVSCHHRYDKNRSTWWTSHNNVHHLFIYSFIYSKILVNEEIKELFFFFFFFLIKLR